MPPSRELAGSSDADASAAAVVAGLAGTVVRFDALACLFPSGFVESGSHAPKQVAERVKLLSESLRLQILMERSTEETAEAGARLLVSMRQLHLLGKTTRLHPSHRTVLRLGLGLVEQIVKGLREPGRRQRLSSDRPNHPDSPARPESTSTATP